MKKILITLFIVCLLVAAVYSPWQYISINLESLFGIKNNSNQSSLEITSLGGIINVYIDNNNLGKTSVNEQKLEIAPIVPGIHTVKLVRKDNYYIFSKSINFVAGGKVSMGFEIGPTQNTTNGWIMIPTPKINENKNTYLIMNLDPPKSTILINNQKIDTTIFVVDVEKIYDIKIQKDDYLPITFQILGLSKEKLNQYRNFNIELDVKLFSLPIKVNG